MEAVDPKLGVYIIEIFSDHISLSGSNLLPIVIYSLPDVGLGALERCHPGRWGGSESSPPKCNQFLTAHVRIVKPQVTVQPRTKSFPWRLREEWPSEPSA